MAQDPFDKIPPIQEEPYRESEPHFREREKPYVEENVTKGAAPRNLVHSIQKIAIPVIGVALAIWLFLPNSGPTNKVADLPEPEVDATKQAAQTSGMISKLKDDADKVPKPVVVPPQTAPLPLSAIPLPKEDSAEIAKLKAEAERREQEIRASVLEAGSFKLVSETSYNPGSGGMPRPGSLDAQARIDATNAMRADAAAAADQARQRAIAAATPKEQQKAKGPNQEFLAEQSTASDRNDVVRQQASAARFLLNQGTVIRTVLLTGLNSDLPGAMRAQVTSDVYDSTNQRHVLIPKGSQIVGAYSSQVVVGQERMLVATNRLILPDGTWVSLAGASAADMIGQSGLEADVNNHFWKMFGTSLILGAATAFLPNDKATISTTTSGGATTNGGHVIANALNETLGTLLERNKNIPPTLTVKPGTEFTFLVAKDMIMNPYSR